MATMAWGSILKKENVKVSQTPGTEMNEARMAEPIDKPALAEDTKMSIVADALIREYFKRHGNDKALAAFDVERVSVLLLFYDQISLAKVCGIHYIE